VREGGDRRTAFADVDSSANASALISYLDAARHAPSIAEAKQWSVERLHLVPGNRVLDVGCGTGDDVVTMASRLGQNGRAVGVDASLVMVAEAQRRHGHRPQVWFGAAEAERLPFGSAAFDACRVERTLQHLSHPDRAVAEMTRVLKPGGRVTALEPDWGTFVIEGADPEVSAHIMAPHVARHPHPHIGRGLRGLLTAQGFSDIEVAAGVVIHTDLESSMRAFFLSGAALRAVSDGRVSESDGEKWLADLQRADSEDRFFCAVTAFRVAGRKDV
jgi:SAM-dependent methyltransferase